MENAPLIGLSRQIALQRQMDVVANNLANVNTSGFKGEKLLFEQFIMPNARDEALPTGNQQVYFTNDWATMHDLLPGTFTQTGGELDVALEGEGFLAVETPQGIRYTRNGELHVDPTGILVNGDGYPVLAETGLITFEPTETGITFSPEGSVITSAGNKGKLQILEFDNAQSLIREGNNLFASNGTDNGATAVSTRLRQGMLEGSNVSGVAEMTNMIRVNRAYQMVAQFIEKHDELRRTAIRQLGELTA